MRGLLLRQLYVARRSYATKQPDQRRVIAQHLTRHGQGAFVGARPVAANLGDPGGGTEEAEAVLGHERTLLRALVGARACWRMTRYAQPNASGSRDVSWGFEGHERVRAFDGVSED